MHATPIAIREIPNEDSLLPNRFQMTVNGKPLTQTRCRFSFIGQNIERSRTMLIECVWSSMKIDGKSSIKKLYLKQSNRLNVYSKLVRCIWIIYSQTENIIKTSEFTTPLRLNPKILPRCSLLCRTKLLN